MKKNVSKIIILLIIITILVLFYIFNNIKYIKIQSVNLNEEFVLKKGEKATIIDKKIYLKVEDFIYSPAPAGTQSIWSGLDVKYELNVDGKSFENSYYSNYNVIIVESDYKTYAKFIITNK